LTEEKLVRDAINGCNNSFREIVVRYESLVASTVINMVGRGQEAEDIGQETFIRFYKNMKNFRGDAKLGTYLTRIAINLSLNELKRRKKRRFLFKEHSPEFENIPDHSPGYKQTEQQQLVIDALQKIDEDSRKVIVLRLIDGFSIKETAQILEMTESAVMSRLFRAQQRLKKVLPCSMGESV